MTKPARRVGNLWPKLGGDAIDFTEKIVRSRIGRIEVDGAAERGDRIAVLAPRVLRYPQSDLKSCRSGIPLNRRGEHRQGIVARAALQMDVSPVEQVFLGRIHVRRALEMIGRAVEVPRKLLHIAQQVVKLTGLFHPQQLRDDTARLVDAANLKQCEREVIAVVVMCRIDGVRPTQVGNGRLHVSLLQVEDGERVVRLEAVRFGANGLCQPSLRSCDLGRVRRCCGLCCRGFHSRQCRQHQREENRTAETGSYQ